MFVVSDNLYLIGGTGPKFRDLKSTGSLGDMDIWDTATMSWTTIVGLTIPRHGHAVAYVGTQIFIMGGVTTVYMRCLSNIECFCGKRSKKIDTPYILIFFLLCLQTLGSEAFQNYQLLCLVMQQLHSRPQCSYRTNKINKTQALCIYTLKLETRHKADTCTTSRQLRRVAHRGRAPPQALLHHNQNPKQKI